MDVLPQGDLEGFKEYIKILSELLDEKQMNALLKQSNREALKPLASKMKSLPYNVKPKIGVRQAYLDGKKLPNGLQVGPLQEKRVSTFRPPDAVLMKFFDLGTKERYATTRYRVFFKKKAWRGKIVGKNLIDPMIQQEANSIKDNIPEVYGAALAKMVGKYAKKLTKTK